MRTSESIKNIAGAMAKFHSIVKDPRKESDNPFFKSKYVDLNGLTTAIRPALKECGLSYIQSTGGDSAMITVTTLILHESGEWIETDPLSIPNAKKDAQGAGSACTYGRRYSLSAAFGIAWSEPDDDGNSASSIPLRNARKEVNAAMNHHDIDIETAKKIVFVKYGAESMGNLSLDNLRDLANNMCEYAKEVSK